MSHRYSESEAQILAAVMGGQDDEEEGSSAAVYQREIDTLERSAEVPGSVLREVVTVFDATMREARPMLDGEGTIAHRLTQRGVDRVTTTIQSEEGRRWVMVEAAYTKEPDCQKTYCVAVRREQARECYDVLVLTVEDLDEGELPDLQFARLYSFAKRNPMVTGPAPTDIYMGEQALAVGTLVEVAGLVRDRAGTFAVSEKPATYPSACQQ